MFDVHKIRDEFPIFQRHDSGKPLIYLDSAATSQKSQKVIDAITNFYENHNANVHRGIYTLSEEATEQYELARKKVAKFINAKSEKEIIFVKNTTEAINNLARMLEPMIKKDDEIATTIMEHHSNFVPWQQLAKRKKVNFRIVDIDNRGNLICHSRTGGNSESRNWIPGQARNDKVKVFALTHVSNVLGTINPVKEIISAIRNTNPSIFTVVDGAQAVAHMPVDVQDLNCDAYVFSAHKMYGPMGVGVLWVKEELLRTLDPVLFGGGMIKSVTTQISEWAAVPEKFEAGTPDVAGAVGLGTAVDWLENIGFSEIKKYEGALTTKLFNELKFLKSLRIYGSDERIGVVSFSIDEIHPHDAAQFLNDRYNICVRAGHHCAMPLHAKLGVLATTRVSLGIYNTEDEIELLIEALKELTTIFK